MDRVIYSQQRSESRWGSSSLKGTETRRPYSIAELRTFASNFPVPTCRRVGLMHRPDAEAK